ncbi:hypothetical protein, partial [Acinetobacter schindleri]|uniref:hypothetical protein n=1 Tax=Acinetobacter schindleri TaxID=108981 RepID=UPI0030F98FCB
MDSQVDVGYLANFFIAFEWNRSLSSHERRDKFLKNESSITERPLLVKHLADIFTDRAGSRVADVS